MKNKTLMIKYMENPTLFQKSFKFAPQGGNDPVPFCTISNQDTTKCAWG